ncbi:MAG: ATP-binding cassette domain-containing protein [Rhodoglobus sp.]
MPGQLDAVIRLSRPGFELDVALAVAPGRVLALLGPNGAGKSTTLSCIAGAIDFDGHVRVGDRSLNELPVERRGVGLVFQDYLLFPHLTVEQNVAFGPRAHGVDKAAAGARAATLLERFGIAELAKRRPSQVSGGQAQRVALARALAVEPDVLLLDEPLAALDAEVREGVRADLSGHLADFAGPTVLVTHSLADVRALAGDVIVLEHGSVTYRGTVDGLRAADATPYLRQLSD